MLFLHLLTGEATRTSLGFLCTLSCVLQYSRHVIRHFQLVFMIQLPDEDNIASSISDT
jgi:hypothetical protein